MTQGHWALSKKEQDDLKAYEAVEKFAEGKTEADRVRRAEVMAKEAARAKMRQAEVEAKTESVRRKRKAQHLLKAAGNRLLKPQQSYGDLDGDNKRAQQRLNMVSGKA